MGFFVWFWVFSLHFHLFSWLGGGGVQGRGGAEGTRRQEWFQKAITFVRIGCTKSGGAVSIGQCQAIWYSSTLLSLTGSAQGISWPGCDFVCFLWILVQCPLEPLVTYSSYCFVTLLFCARMLETQRCLKIFLVSFIWRAINQPFPVKKILEVAQGLWSVAILIYIKVLVEDKKNKTL